VQKVGCQGSYGAAKTEKKSGHFVWLEKNLQKSGKS